MKALGDLKPLLVHTMTVYIPPTNNAPRNVKATWDSHLHQFSSTLFLSNGGYSFLFQLLIGKSKQIPFPHTLAVPRYKTWGTDLTRPGRGVHINNQGKSSLSVNVVCVYLDVQIIKI